MRINLLAETDPDAPNTGALQQRIIARPLGSRAGSLLLVSVHGSSGDAGSMWHREPDNNPNFPADKGLRRVTFSRKISSVVPMVTHDFAAINPVTGVLDVNQFGSKAVMDQINAIRTNLAPKLGCRSDKILLHGESQGSQVVWFYTLLYPQNVAAASMTMPGCDIEIDRYGQFSVNINQNWGYATTGRPSLTLGVGGPALRIGGPLGIAGAAWTSGTTYAVNDMVFADANSAATNSWRCVSSHTASGSTIPYTDSSKWLPMDPMGVHYSVPSEGGTSLAFQSGTPLAGQPASPLEPANVTRMRKIISGQQTGIAVPVECYYSGGDQLSMSAGSNGISGGDPGGVLSWYGSAVDARMTRISDVYNHAGHPQPLDPKYQTVGSNTVKAKAGGNAELMFRLQGTWGGTVAFEATTDATGATGWVSRNANSTIPVRANPATEGPNITSTAVNGYYRMNMTGYVWGRAVHTGSGTCSITAGPTYSDASQYGAVPTDTLIDHMMRVA